MQFTPKTENEIIEAALWPEGVYDFEIVEASDTISKKGNEMIALSLRVYDANGGHRFVNDYLLESMAFKLRHCAYACGLGSDYENGFLAAEKFVGRSGKLKLGVEKPRDDKYPPKNTVRDYIVGGDEKISADDQKVAPIDDSIPWA